MPATTENLPICLRCRVPISPGSSVCPHCHDPVTPLASQMLATERGAQLRLNNPWFAAVHATVRRLEVTGGDLHGFLVDLLCDVAEQREREFQQEIDRRVQRSISHLDQLVKEQIAERAMLAPRAGS